MYLNNIFIFCYAYTTLLWYKHKYVLNRLNGNRESGARVPLSQKPIKLLYSNDYSLKQFLSSHSKHLIQSHSTQHNCSHPPQWALHFVHWQKSDYMVWVCVKQLKRAPLELEDLLKEFLSLWIKRLR